MSPDKLAYMANQIGRFFASQGPERAPAAIAVGRRIARQADAPAAGRGVGRNAIDLLSSPLRRLRLHRMPFSPD